MSSGSKGGMTPKERIHAAARGLPADRVPVFYWIEAHTGCRLMAEFKQDILESYRTGRAKNRHILGTTHEIQYTMPDDNIRVLFETVGDIQAGRYD